MVAGVKHSVVYVIPIPSQRPDDVGKGGRVPRGEDADILHDGSPGLVLLDVAEAGHRQVATAPGIRPPLPQPAGRERMARRSPDVQANTGMSMPLKSVATLRTLGARTWPWLGSTPLLQCWRLTPRVTGVGKAAICFVKGLPIVERDVAPPHRSHTSGTTASVERHGSNQATGGGVVLR